MYLWELPHKGKLPLSELGLTLITAFCNDLHRFDHQFDIWRSYSDHIKNNLYILIVDDCSGHPVHHLVDERAAQIDFNLGVYRITDDLKWNIPGSWNLGFTQAVTNWAVNLPSDMAFLPEDMERLMTLRPMEGHLYKFLRERVTGEDWIKRDWNKTNPQSEVFLMEKEVHRELGGYDEDFTGEYSGGYAAFDYHFVSKVARRCYPFGAVKEVITTEFMEDVFGSEEKTRSWRHDEDIKINRRLMRAKEAGEVSEEVPMLRFKWEKMLEFRRFGHLYLSK
jgi:hypothetical protein